MGRGVIGCKLSNGAEEIVKQQTVYKGFAHHTSTGRRRHMLAA